jgi:hypothetical protein
MIYKYDGFRDYHSQVEYHRNKTGPNYFVVYYKQRSVVCYDRIDVKRAFGVAKFTPSIKELGEWCDEMIEKYDKDSLPVVLDTANGFGPECHPEDPTAATRMVI